jgi:predicted HAD superfamily Cof-like phosphohydrolase
MQEQVRDLMRALHQPTPNRVSTDLPPERLKLRLTLIEEEFWELREASGCADQVDALCDLLYVTLGMAVEMGVDLEPFFELVHEANMKKIGGPVRADGKGLKPEGWTPPDIAGLLAKMENP